MLLEQGLQGQLCKASKRLGCSAREAGRSQALQLLALTVVHNVSPKNSKQFKKEQKQLHPVSGRQ
eukprot:5467734-Amphidinium_carterae.1